MEFDFGSILAARRDRERHTEPELRYITQGAAKGAIPDYQLAAWLMAAYLNPLDDEETAWLTQAMAESGERIDLSGLPKPWVDKHSTGGVGDKTSIVLLPMLAACGLTVVKMSGRGLGATGGTLDKLGSVAGFRTDLTADEMKAQAARVGLAITGQSPNLAPADKALYALRDVTATVGSVPLIVSSILSKKLAGGADTIVLDVKSGSGGLMETEAEARELAAALARTARACGLHCRLALTDMSQPLGAVGNAVEVDEARAVLRGEERGPATERLVDLCIEMAGLALEAAEVAPDRDTGRTLARRSLESGAALGKAGDWFDAQGGSLSADLPSAPVKRIVAAQADGWVAGIEARGVGVAVVAMGGGRRRKDDPIDPAVGVEFHVCVGSKVRHGDPLFTLHAASSMQAETAEARIYGAFEFSHERVEPRPVVLETF
jgi:pyrimidine-nucleoside phosphorylase